jgi:membrane-associated phospholipid phosphatase
VNGGLRLSRGTIVCLALFAIVSLLVSTGVTHDADVATLQWIGTVRSPTLIRVMQLLSTIGNWQWEVPFALLVSLLLWRHGRRRSAWRYFAFCVAGDALYGVAKLLFHRPRPTVISHLSDAGWYSYPSGHAMLAVIIWGAGLVLLAQLVTARAMQRSLTGLGVLLPIAIAKSRVYLGVHYPTDVLGGMLLGLAWVLGWWRVVCDRPAHGAAPALPTY